MEILQLVGDYTKRDDGWYDKDGNSWNTLEEAKKYSPTLIDCKNCTDCKYCTNCIGCFNCNYCIKCVSCFHCSSCANCYNVSDSRLCVNCSSCSRCTNCSNCKLCDSCNDCINCEDCTKCSSCSDCYKCSSCCRCTVYCLNCKDCKVCIRCNRCIGQEFGTGSIGFNIRDKESKSVCKRSVLKMIYPLCNLLQLIIEAVILNFNRIRNLLIDLNLYICIKTDIRYQSKDKRTVVFTVSSRDFAERLKMITKDSRVRNGIDGQYDIYI